LFAYNVHQLCDGLVFNELSARTSADRKTKDEDNNKKLIYILQPGTVANRELQPIVIPSASLLPNLM
jgi:hypothetical protein